MNHDEIRFRVLSNLYHSQFDGRVKNWIHLDDVIEGAGLQEADRNAVLGDVVYLSDKRLLDIQGRNVSDDSTVPESMRITSYGIDHLEDLVGEQLRKEQEYRSWLGGKGKILEDPQVKEMAEKIAKEAGTGAFSRTFAGF